MAWRRAGALFLLACCLTTVLGVPKPKCRVPRCLACGPSQRTCRTCQPFEPGSAGNPKWPVYKDRKGQCNTCTKCPYSKGWAGCDSRGNCKGFCEGKGYRVDPLEPKKCTCRWEEGYRLEKGRCVNTPCPGPGVRCRRDPCQMADCPDGTYCLSDYCQGCNARCIPGEKPCEVVQCLVSPCSLEENASTCKPWEKCVDDYCWGCNFRCEALPDRKR